MSGISNSFQWDGSIMATDITAWERNIYKCDRCNLFWSVSFPIKDNQTIINEESLYCNQCLCIGRIIKTKQEPARIGKMNDY